MNEDDLLLRELGQLARDEAESERARWDERWDRLAAGTLGAEEDAELRRLAVASPEAGEAYEAFRPLGAEFHAAVATAIAAQATGAAEPTTAAARVADRGGAAANGGKLLPFPVRRLAVWGTAVGAATAAMVAMLVRILVPLAPLPVYSIAEISGASRTTRGELIEAPRFAPGDRCQVVLQPATAVPRAGSLRAEAFLVGGGELRPWEVKGEVVESTGAVRVSGRLAPELPAGTWTLWLIVGRKGTLPDAASVRTFSTAAPVRERNWVALPKTLSIQPRAPD
ncbi:MAG TPA: hypothetical protein VFS60_09935 [Thermoanaerobaculia bacterium]|nr:hypothetical protein [Thermoanaerobaculia bacterium]